MVRIEAGAETGEVLSFFGVLIITMKALQFIDGVNKHYAAKSPLTTSTTMHIVRDCHCCLDCCRCPRDVAIARLHLRLDEIEILATFWVRLSLVGVRLNEEGSCAAHELVPHMGRATERRAHADCDWGDFV